MNDAKLAHPSLDRLTEFAHGRLAEAELAELSAHLSDCTECREKVEATTDDTLISLLRAADTDHDSVATKDPHKTVTLAPLSPTGDYPVSKSPGLPQELADHSRYRVQELLGVGGMGSVYKAEHLLMERPVALKLISQSLTSNPAMVERFRREVKTAGQLKHPNIVMAYDAEQAGDSHFLVMEYVEGKSLARLVGEQGPLPVHLACDYIRQAALGLQYAHERGMVHRDIKPHNFMVTFSHDATAERGDPDSRSAAASRLNGVVKILDFGLARFAMEAAPAGALLATSPTDAMPGSSGGKSDKESLTQVGTVMGTPDYIAPEQATDAHTADIRADIYSLGCTLYDLLAGHAPFPEGTAVAKVMAHAERLPKPLTEIRNDLPAELARVIERMIAKDPAKRYQTPAEVAAALAPFAVRAPVRPRRRVWAAIAALLVAGIVTAAGVIYKIQRDNEEIVIKTDDPFIEVVMKRKGEVVLIRDENSGQTWEYDTLKNQIGLADQPDGLTLGVDKEAFVLRRKGKDVFAVTRVVKTAASPNSDQGRIQGLWKAVAASGQGQQFPEELIKAIGPNITFSDKKVIWKANPSPKANEAFGGILAKFSLEGLFSLDPAKSPKTIDLTVLGSNPKTPLGTPAPRAILGIYKLEGDSLEICVAIDPEHAEERPAKFESVPGKFIAHVKLKRASAAAMSKATLINSFGVGFKPITRDGLAEDDGAWKIDATRARFVRLYEVQPPVEECLIYYRAKIKSSNLHGKAYLEMWARMPQGGEYYSKGLTTAVIGTTEWVSADIPFVLQKDERPDLFKLGLRIEPNAPGDQGAAPSDLPATVWIKDIEIWQSPLPAAMRRPSQVVTTDNGAAFQWQKKFDTAPLTQDGVSSDQGGWRIIATGNRTVNLHEFTRVKESVPSNATLQTFRARMKASDLHGQAYLELIGQVPEEGEKSQLIARGVALPLTGTTDWASFETSFRCEKGRPLPRFFKLNLVIEGKGTVWIKDIELLRGPAPLDPGERVEMDLLQGVWLAESMEINGKPASAKELASTRFTFMKDKILIRDSKSEGKDQQATYLMTDWTQSPKHLDITIQNKTLHGIFEVNGDVLKVCYETGDDSANRPTKFATSKEKESVLIVFRRQKP